jgi:hypothetical protein
MVLTISFALSPVIGLCCHRRLADTGVSGPLGLTSPLRHLTPTIEASGPHDFAVRKITRSSVAQPASIASQPYVRDDRETPLVYWAGMARDVEVIWVKMERKYFCEEDWTGSISLIQFNKSP